MATTLLSGLRGGKEGDCNSTRLGRILTQGSLMSPKARLSRWSQFCFSSSSPATGRGANSSFGKRVSKRWRVPPELVSNRLPFAVCHSDWVTAPRVQELRSTDGETHQYS